MPGAGAHLVAGGAKARDGSLRNAVKPAGMLFEGLTRHRNPVQGRIGDRRHLMRSLLQALTDFVRSLADRVSRFFHMSDMAPKIHATVRQTQRRLLRYGIDLNSIAAQGLAKPAQTGVDAIGGLCHVSTLVHQHVADAISLLSCYADHARQHLGLFAQ